LLFESITSLALQEKKKEKNEEESEALTFVPSLSHTFPHWMGHKKAANNNRA